MSKPVLLKSWLEHYRKHVTSGIHRPKTASDILRRLDLFFERFPDRKFPEDIFLSDIEDYRNIRRADSLAENTIAQEMVVVKNFYAWLKLRGVDVLNPARSITAARDERAFPTLSVGEISKILSAANHPLDKIVVLLGLTLGLRLIDLSHITWDAFEDNFSVLVLDGRTLPLRHDISDLLRASYTNNKDTQSSNREGYLFPEKRAEYRWKQVRQRAALLDVPYLSLRNTLALFLVRLKVDLVSARHILGRDMSPMFAALELEPPTNDIARRFVESLPLPPQQEDHSSPDVSAHIPEAHSLPISQPQDCAVCHLGHISGPLSSERDVVAI